MGLTKATEPSIQNLHLDKYNTAASSDDIELLRELAEYASVHTRFRGVPERLPVVLRMESIFFDTEVCGAKTDKQRERCTAAGLHPFGSHYIFMDGSLEPALFASVLYHEYIHFRQGQEHGPVNECAKVIEFEREAYQLQHFFKVNVLGYTGGFHLPPMQCAPR